MGASTRPIKLDGNEKVILTDKNAKEIKKQLIANWPKVLEHYEALSKAAKLYYENLLKGCKKALAIDVEWAGSGIIRGKIIIC